MEDKRIIEIITKYLTGQINDEEQYLLEKWKEESGANKYTFNALKETWEELSEEPDAHQTDELIDKIWYEGVEKDKLSNGGFDWSFFIKVAAVFLIALSSVLIVFIGFESSPEDVISATAFTVKENPAGQKTKIYLPDSSVVWLNGASKLIYSPNFNHTSRDVELIGEAYFEVAKDLKKPFTVKTHALNTVALGTSFNIQAYPDQENILISLLTGKVSIENPDENQFKTTLTPGNELLFNKESGKGIEQKFDYHDVIGWKEGWLIFKDSSYEEFVKKIERWFGVKVITEGTPPEDWVLTTSYKNEMLLNILKNIRYGKTFNFELTQDQLTIKF